MEEANVGAKALEPSESYSKVHRSYMVTAGLLAAWEILGISPKKGAGSEATEITIGGLTIEVDTPDSAVWVVVFLLAYFAIRLSLVWGQQPQAVRLHRNARFDYWLSHTLGGVAFAAWGLAYGFGLTRLGALFKPLDFDEASVLVSFMVLTMTVSNLAYLHPRLATLIDRFPLRKIVRPGTRMWVTTLSLLFGSVVTLLVIGYLRVFYPYLLYSDEFVIVNTGVLVSGPFMLLGSWALRNRMISKRKRAEMS